uniref:Putative da-p36 protein n=1 Tax=Rhipicephalus pulchellus TaxID=72859 RepID=L7LTD7_RHIPC
MVERTGTMKLVMTLGLISLLIVTTEAVEAKIQKTTGQVFSARQVEKANLTKQAERYFQRPIHRNVFNWSFTGDFAGLTQRPVTAKVENLVYDGNCSGVEKLTTKKCHEVNFWHIKRGIVTPFRLFVNVTLPNDKHGQVLTFDINNATNAYLNPKDLTKTIKHISKTLRRIEEKCTFSVPVLFEGYILYTRKPGRGDLSDHDALGIGNIEEKDIGFIKISENRLSYNITGTYFVACLPVG